MKVQIWKIIFIISFLKKNSKLNKIIYQKTKNKIKINVN